MMDIVAVAAEMAARTLVHTVPGGGPIYDALRILIHDRLRRDPNAAPIVAELEQEQLDEEDEGRLRVALLDVMVMDEVFAGKVVTLVGQSMAGGADVPHDVPSMSAQSSTPETPPARPAPSQPDREPKNPPGPVRGFPGLTVAATSPQTTAGSDFSIFVLVQNPFDVPITVHNVQTHIPIELLDVNQYRLSLSQANKTVQSSSRNPWTRLKARRELRKAHRGVAIAVGTEFAPEAGELFKNEISVSRDLNIGKGGTASFSAVSFIIPPGVTSDDLDAMMRRALDYQRGVVPICLQPGDSVVRQFVLRTRSKLLFRPLSHTFQIQVNYSVDGVDHTGTVPYQLTIQAALGSIAWGSALGAAVGGILKGLSASGITYIGSDPVAVLQGVAIAIMATIGVVVAFARKSSVQPIVSVEDFWGGFVIGFSVGYFGFDSFSALFPSSGG
ncbi:hypothetical protein [Micromonospora sp. CP22]|uniref:hypothetical protein n=1 Tax=Micromonospora sp. CP22 TaxID=2580517 RepID=UPI0012BCE31C|nr:hypothetical protein [Micromonospora sp. CP22]MTK05182.1 hypothetical protein [Micromonospora sp. CP22]